MQGEVKLLVMCYWCVFSPSMTANTKEDHKLKVGMVDDTFTIINLEKILTGEEEQIGGFDLIYKRW